MAKEKELSAVDEVMAECNKKFGEGTIMRLGDTTVQERPVISTGSLALDLATGIGGIPRGAVTEIWGPESAGKSTLAMHIVAEAQKAGGLAVYIDAEQAFDRTYAAKLGVDTDNLRLSQPGSGEQALEIAVRLAATNEVSVIVIDSVAALVPQAELEGEMGASHMGLQARLMSQALRKLTPVIADSKTALVFINQIRMKIGFVMGNPETTTGGGALKFYSSLRMEIRKKEVVKNEDGTPGGIISKVVIKKNKCAPPFREAMLSIVYGTGIDQASDVLDTGIFIGIITQKGASYTFGDTKLGYGRDATLTTMREDAGLLQDLRDSVRANMRQKRGLTAVPAEAADG